MALSFYVETIEANDGTELNFSGSDIVLLVGPNNVGKSALLKEIHAVAQNFHHPLQIARSIRFRRLGDQAELMAWLAAHSKEESETTLARRGGRIHKKDLPHLWGPGNTDGLRALGAMMVDLVQAETRLNAAGPTQSFKVTTQTPEHPIHYLYQDDELEARISDHFRRAFGEDLIVHRGAGNQIPLYCGQTPARLPGEDRVASRYLRELEKLPMLHTQGHGMRSFVACLLYATVIEYFVVLIDEPELFLHPPQARLLGRMLAEDKPSDRQLFLATHSGDFLRGVMDERDAEVRIIRVRREGDTNPMRALEPNDVRRIWSDPLLRYSNVLDGLFHELVVVCEGDADCRFYGAVTDAIEEDESGTRRPDVMFTHCGGKYRVSNIVQALRALDVPVRVVVDIDALSEEELLRRIWEALGGDWSELEREWRIVKAAVDGLRPSLKASDVIKEIRGQLDKVTGDVFPEATAQEVRELLRRSSPWKLLKTTGKTLVPKGQATQAIDKLFQTAKIRGLFISEVGELEGFDRSTGGKGPAWVNSVVAKDLRSDAGLRGAREFVSELVYGWVRETKAG